MQSLRRPAVTHDHTPQSTENTTSSSSSAQQLQRVTRRGVTRGVGTGRANPNSGLQSQTTPLPLSVIRRATRPMWQRDEADHFRDSDTDSGDSERAQPESHQSQPVSHRTSWTIHDLPEEEQQRLMSMVPRHTGQVLTESVVEMPDLNSDYTTQRSSDQTQRYYNSRSVP